MKTYGKLREKIKDKYETLDSFSDAMGKSRTTLSFKLNGKVPWTMPDIELVCKLLDIPKKEITDYFFYD